MHIKHFENYYFFINGILLQNNKNIGIFHSYEVLPCVPRMSNTSFDFHRHKSNFLIFIMATNKMSRKITYDLVFIRNNIIYERLLV